MPKPTAPTADATEPPIDATPSSDTTNDPTVSTRPSDAALSAPPPEDHVDGGADLRIIQAELDKARKEAAKSRIELKRLQDAEREREDAERSELQKAMDRVSESERRMAEQTEAYQDMAVRLTAQTEAIRLGFRRPGRAHREIDLAAVTFDEGGQPTNLRALLEAELVERPELKASPPAVPDSGAGPRGASPGLTLEEIRRRAKEEPDWINQNWAEVQRVLGSAGR